MRNRRVVFLAVTFFLVSTLSAQLANPSGGGRGEPFHFGFHGSFRGGHGFFGPGHHRFGTFFFTRPSFFFPNRFILPRPFFFPGRHFTSGPSGLADPDGFRYHAGPRIYSPFAFGPAGSYNSFSVGPYQSGWDWLVQEWADQDPRKPPDASRSTLSESLLLKEGMDEEAVMSVLGSPVQRVTLGSKEVWKYSGYSLLFEKGRLTEMR